MRVVKGGGGGGSSSVLCFFKGAFRSPISIVGGLLGEVPPVLSRGVLEHLHQHVEVN